MSYYAKGDVFSCPSCKDPILEFIQDVHSGERCFPSAVRGLQQEIISGDPMICRNCGRDYAKELIHKSNNT